MCNGEPGSARTGRVTRALYLCGLHSSFRAALPRGQATVRKCFLGFCFRLLRSCWLKQVTRTNAGSVGEEIVQELGCWEASRAITRMIHHGTPFQTRFPTVCGCLSLSYRVELCLMWLMVCDFPPCYSSLSYPNPTAPTAPRALPHDWVFVAVSS